MKTSNVYGFNLRIWARFAVMLTLYPGFGMTRAYGSALVAHGIHSHAFQPVIHMAPNGVPIVHITAPNASGVSRNQYEQFNVGPNGLILNNSAAQIQSQLAGMIAANAQLGATAARVILNEVVSANPSRLLGRLEVAGQRADVIIANPNGITCRGCGFINTGRLTLTTGIPQFGANGSIQGFDVRKGELRIEGEGLNASQIERLDLIARGLVVEGKVQAKEVKAVLGSNAVNYETLEAKTQQGEGNALAFAVDVKETGGMHAN